MLEPTVFSLDPQRTQLIIVDVKDPNKKTDLLRSGFLLVCSLAMHFIKFFIKFGMKYSSVDVCRVPVAVQTVRRAY